MERLIDANVVLAKKFTTGLSDASGNYYGNADVVFVDDIENAQTVDAVPVVRCEYCNKGHPELDMNGCVWCVRYSRDMNTYDFCSYGERKDDGSDG